MLIVLVEYRLCMFSIIVYLKYVVYGVYMWSINGVHVLSIVYVKYTWCTVSRPICTWCTRVANT